MRAQRERRWPAVVAACAGMLVLPLGGWLLFAPPSARLRAKAAPALEAEDTETGRAAAPHERRAPEPSRRAAAAATVATAQENGVEGEVVGPDDKPVPEAGVHCVLGDRELEATTDEAGRFRFAADAAGCTAVAKKRGFAPSAEATFGAGVRLRLAPTAGIAGSVVDEDGAPVMTYMLGVESFEPPGGNAPDGGAAALPPRIAVNDAEGAFMLEDLAPGRYVLAAGAPLRTVGRAAPIEVRAGTVTKGVRIALKRGRTVAGTIIDARTKLPLVGAFVFAETGPERNVRSTPAFTAPDGSFTLDGTCPEACTIYAWSPGYTNNKLAGLHVPATGELRVEIALSRIGDAPP